MCLIISDSHMPIPLRGISIGWLHYSKLKPSFLHYRLNKQAAHCGFLQKSGIYSHVLKAYGLLCNGEYYDTIKIVNVIKYLIIIAQLWLKLCGNDAIALLWNLSLGLVLWACPCRHSAIYQRGTLTKNCLLSLTEKNALFTFDNRITSVVLNCKNN